MSGTAKPKRSKARPASDAYRSGGPSQAVKVPANKDETEAQAFAKVLLAPDFRHAMAASQLFTTTLGKSDLRPGLGDLADAYRDCEDKAAKGELAFASRMLAAQAVTLDNIFAEMTRRMACNMGEHLQATEIYGRLALKAQANSRATLEALAKLHQPREQTVRHVHVNEGGQAVIADQFHNHTGGPENGEIVKQPYEQGARGAALPSPDPTRDGVPIAGIEGPEALQAARRDVAGGAEG